jgi:Tfp pilus assembly protein PilO
MKTNSLKAQIGLCTRMQFALIAVVAIVLTLFYFAGFRPQNQKKNELRVQIAQVTKDLQASQTQAGRLPRVAADLVRLRAQLADFKKLPNDLELGEFVKQITQISRQAQVASLEYNLGGAPHQHEQFTEQPVTLRFDGNFVNVFEFLRQVEDLPRLARISTIAVHGTEVRGGSVHVDMSMDLYYSEG